MPVEDHSHHNSHIVEDGGIMSIHYGAVVQVSATPNKELPPLPRCPAPSPHYVHRKRLENHMASYFFNRQGIKRYVLHGLGGSGKTEAGLNFVNKHFYSDVPEKRRFSQAYWVDATSVTTIQKSLKDIAQSVGAGSSADHALLWLASRDGDDVNWIIFFDNADDPQLELPKYFPKCSYGSILITTRNHCATQYALGPDSSYHASELEEDEACKLLQNRAQIFDPSPSDFDVITTLVKELNRFPLSVSQAAAYMLKTPCTPKEYLELLCSHRQQVLREQDAMSNPDGYQYCSVQATLKISYDRLCQPAKQLLQLFAFLHLGGIHEEIFRNMCLGLSDYTNEDGRLRTEGEDEAIAWLREFREVIVTDDQWDMHKYRSLVGVLRSYSLASLSPEKTTCSVHPVIQEWTRGIPNAFESTNTTGSRVAAVLLASSTILNPRQTTKELAFLRGLVPHVDQVMKHNNGLFNACKRQFGYVLRYAGRYNDMAGVVEEYMDVCKRELGPTDPTTLGSMHELGVAYRNQGQYEKAVELLSTAFKHRQVQFGLHHRATLASMTCLGNAYSSQRCFAKAVELYSLALDNYKVLLGSEHLDTLASMTCLGNAYSGQGEFGKASELHSQALGIYRMQPDLLDHPDALASMNSLGNAYFGQGQYEKAVELYSQALDICKTRLGLDHPLTLLFLNNIGHVHNHQGQYDQAVEPLSQALEIRRAKLGLNHPDTLESEENLRLALQGQRQASTPNKQQPSRPCSPSPHPAADEPLENICPDPPRPLRPSQPPHASQLSSPTPVLVTPRFLNVPPPPPLFPAPSTCPSQHPPLHSPSPLHLSQPLHPSQSPNRFSIPSPSPVPSPHPPASPSWIPSPRPPASPSWIPSPRPPVSPSWIPSPHLPPSPYPGPYWAPSTSPPNTIPPSFPQFRDTPSPLHPFQVPHAQPSPRMSPFLDPYTSPPGFVDPYPYHGPRRSSPLPGQGSGPTCGNVPYPRPW